MTEKFNGLTMPVFIAFGWAGEKNAIDYALGQLSLFVEALQGAISHEAQTMFPYFGLDKEGQYAWLAMQEEPEKGIHITFQARPMGLRTTIILSDRKGLQAAFKLASADTTNWYKAIQPMAAEWSIRLQQMEVNSKTGEIMHYKDVVKEPIADLTTDKVDELIATGEYLNGETDRWLAPLFFTRAQGSEMVSAMNLAILNETAKDIQNLLPIFNLLSGTKGKRTRAPAKKKRATKKKETANVFKADGIVIPTLAKKKAAKEEPTEGFDYTSEVKPFHLRKGFINMTPEHWPFFAIKKRSTMREVTVHYGGKLDSKCAVWRLVPQDMARLVLSPPVHDWLTENIVPNDQIALNVIKTAAGDIEIKLQVA